MSVDIKMDTEEARFKLRTCPVLCIENRLLVSTNQKIFYAFPGGHVELGETTEEALVRETFEETGFDVEINNLLCIMQNIQNIGNKLFHEVAYYYNVSLKDKKVEEQIKKDFSNNKFSFDWTENDKGKLRTAHFKWVTLDELKHIDFYPKPLIDVLGDLKEFKAITYKAV